MAKYDEIFDWLGQGYVCRRKSWNGEKAIVGIVVAHSRQGFAITISGVGELHDEIGNMLRFFPSDDDKAADDWEYASFRVTLESFEKVKVQ
jgi:hypothetical protein